MKIKKGQVVVESVVGMGVLFVLVSGIWSTYLFLGSHLWIQHHLYTSLFCVAQGYSINVCKNQMLNQTKRFVVWGELKKFKLTQRGKTWRGSLVWELMGKSFQFQRSLTIPTDLLKGK